MRAEHIQENTIHEYTRNHTNNWSCFVPLRVDSWIRIFRSWPQVRFRFMLGLPLLLLLIELVGAQPVRTSATQDVPRVFLLDGKQLQETRNRIRAGGSGISAAWEKLDKEAQTALRVGPFSVVTKDPTPPSGDKHDYMSQAPYFWPDAAKADGLPYIRRDGERNPEINKISDHKSLDQMVGAVETLALAYYFKNNEAYATKAVELLRAFFLDPKTRMNPHLQFAQAIPGVNTGRGIGLIETRGLTRVVDAVGLLAGSKALQAADRHGLKDWFRRFLKWMLESKNGRDEAAARNNHGTYYDLQITSFALFLGEKEFARDILQAARNKRIAVQIEPDGRQPLELARTKAWSYSVGNLEGLMLLATIGEKVGVDLWNYQRDDGRSIRRALDYLAPVALGEQKWTYQQLGEWPPEMLFPLMRRAAARYRDAQFLTLLERVPDIDLADRGRLLGADPVASSQAQR